MIAKRKLALVLACPVLVAPLPPPGALGAEEPQVRVSDPHVRAVSAGGLVAVDVAPTAGISSARTRTWSAAPNDFDRDGDQDVLVGYHPVEMLWRNEGDGTYQRVASEAWPAGSTDRHNCSWADVDRNGLPDVMCSAGRGLANRVKDSDDDNELWLQTSAEEFVEVGTEWGLGDECGRGRDVAFLDADGDQFPDLFVGNRKPRATPDVCDGSPLHPNERSKLYLNQDGGGFVPAQRLWPYGIGTRCIEVLDFNRDGWDDLFTCRALGETPRLYRNDEGDGFTDVTRRRAFGEAINDAHVIHLRGDRHPDLVTAGPRGFALHLNDAGRFRAGLLVFQPARGFGMAVAAGDADRDGDQDLYAMVGNGPDGNPADHLLVSRRSSFRAVRVSGVAGAADDVVALRRTRGGRVEFLALDGYNLEGVGPVRLIRLVRSPEGG